jgi:RNA methyltransferase, TrmH family
VKRWVRLAQDGRFRRTERRALIEGPHLVEAAFSSGYAVEAILLSDEARPEARQLAGKSGMAIVELGDKIFRSIVDAESPQGIAAEIAIAERPARPDRDSVYLEAIQDAGNVGAIIRSAAAFGIGNVFLDRGCADPWSPKVLRAGMGGHFQLSLVQTDAPPDVNLVCAVAHGGTVLSKARLVRPLCWVLGAEGRGVSEALREKALEQVTIALAKGTESLNVAAAAAICFYEAFSRRAPGS